MFKKTKSKKGFTLVELLIVLAIIAILAAIAIPMYSAQMEKARIKVDQANLRAAESMAVAAYMLEASTTADKDFYFDIDSKGNLAIVDTAPTTGYNQSKTPTGSGSEVAVKSKVIKITVGDGGQIKTATWQ